jgi:hypothetical protein
MSSSDLQDWLDERDGFAGVSELAAFLGEDENVVRRFARQHDLRRVGSTYVFTFADAAELIDSRDGDDDDDDDEVDDEVDEDEDEDED